MIGRLTHGYAGLNGLVGSSAPLSITKQTISGSLAPEKAMGGKICVLLCEARVHADQ